VEERQGATSPRELADMLSTPNSQSDDNQLPSDDGISQAEQQEFYHRIASSGKLADVKSASDLDALPPHITHVRWPDGRVERIGFS
jgi:hypothetical protein